MSLTATYDSVLSRVRISSTGLGVADTGSRTVSGGLGVADTGQPWTPSHPTDSSVSSGELRFSLPSLNSSRRALLPDIYSDCRMRALLRIPTVGVGDDIETSLMLRYQDSSNYLQASLFWDGDSTFIDAQIVRRQAGTPTTLDVVTLPFTQTGANLAAWVHAEVIGSLIRAKIWASNGVEPDDWTLTATDATWSTGKAGLRFNLQPGFSGATPQVCGADNITVTAAPVAVERSTDRVRWTPVRGGADMTVVNGSVELDDYEFTPDVTNYYRASAHNGYAGGTPLNANPSFEVDASGWAGTGASVARSTAQAHDGVASLLITPNGVSASGGANATTRVAVAAGRTYLASVWAYSPAGWSDLRPAVDWYTALSGGSFISTSLGSAFAASAGVWTLLAGVYTAPAGAVGAVMRARHAGTPTAGDVWYADEIQLQDLAVPITPTLDGVWLKSIARPFLNRKVSVSRVGDVKRASRAGVFDIIGRSHPLAVNDVRGSRRWDMIVRAETLDEAELLDLIVASGDTLLIHTPAGSTVPGGYVTVGETTEKRFGPVNPLRHLALPCQEVAAPGPDVIGSTSTCTTVLNTYATCDDVLAAHATIADLLELIGDPEEVLVP